MRSIVAMSVNHQKSAATMAPMGRHFDAMVYSCNHLSPTTSFVVLYCLLLSLMFVGGLYLIPTEVKNLPRSHERQIKWRIGSVLTSCLISTVLYPELFCDQKNVFEEVVSAPGAMFFMGWFCVARRDLAVLVHVMVLYLGAISVSFAKIHVATTHTVGAYFCAPRTQRIGYVAAFHDVALRPTQRFFRDSDAAEKWGKIRDLVVAPLAEEIVFRGCMIAPLLSTGIAPAVVAWIAPLFFGTAHLHHAMLKLRDGSSLTFVFVNTMFQLAYTTLFGAYSTHAFIRTGSLAAVFLCHTFCNFMGLPDLSFLKQHGSPLSCVYCFRHKILTAYVVGVVLFGFGFTCGSRNIFYNFCLLPDESIFKF